MVLMIIITKSTGVAAATKHTNGMLHCNNTLTVVDQLFCFLFAHLKYALFPGNLDGWNMFFGTNKIFLLSGWKSQIPPRKALQFTIIILYVEMPCFNLDKYCNENCYTFSGKSFCICGCICIQTVKTSQPINAILTLIKILKSNAAKTSLFWKSFSCNAIFDWMSHTIMMLDVHLHKMKYLLIKKMLQMFETIGALFKKNYFMYGHKYITMAIFNVCYVHIRR